MKIVVRDRTGYEKLVCESVGEYHGNLFVSIMNQNFATKTRKESYKIVSMDYEINAGEKSVWWFDL